MLEKSMQRSHEIRSFVYRFIFSIQFFIFVTDFFVLLCATEIRIF